jgi:hypothetical protein
MITYKGGKHGAMIPAKSLDFELDDLKAKQGRKTFTYRDPNGDTLRLLVDTDQVVEAVELPDLPGPA